jgi:hypothetical protein
MKLIISTVVKQPILWSFGFRIHVAQQAAIISKGFVASSFKVDSEGGSCNLLQNIPWVKFENEGSRYIHIQRITMIT